MSEVKKSDSAMCWQESELSLTLIHHWKNVNWHNTSDSHWGASHKAECTPIIHMAQHTNRNVYLYSPKDIWEYSSTISNSPKLKNNQMLINRRM